MENIILTAEEWSKIKGWLTEKGAMHLYNANFVAEHTPYEESERRKAKEILQFVESKHPIK